MQIIFSTMCQAYYLPIVTVFSWVNGGLGLEVDTGYWIRILDDSSEASEDDVEVGKELSETLSVLYGNTTCTS